jgi:hypothetical protein
MTQSRPGSPTAWQGDWEARLTERLRARGFESAADYVATAPTASLIVLGHALGSDPTAPLYTGDGFAATQLERRLIDDAKRTGTLERCMRDLLVRQLHEHLPEGWHLEWGPDIPGDTTTAVWRRAIVFSQWGSEISLRYPEYEPAVDAVWDAMKASAIADGWLPSSADDPLLVDVFRRSWRGR